MVADDDDGDDDDDPSIKGVISRDGALTGAAGPIEPGDLEMGFSWDFTLFDGEMFTIEKTKTIKSETMIE